MHNSKATVKVVIYSNFLNLISFLFSIKRKLIFSLFYKLLRQDVRYWFRCLEIIICGSVWSFEIILVTFSELFQELFFKASSFITRSSSRFHIQLVYCIFFLKIFPYSLIFLLLVITVNFTNKLSCIVTIQA